MWFCLENNLFLKAFDKYQITETSSSKPTGEFWLHHSKICVSVENNKALCMEFILLGSWELFNKSISYHTQQDFLEINLAVCQSGSLLGQIHVGPCYQLPFSKSLTDGVSVMVCVFSPHVVFVIGLKSVNHAIKSPCNLAAWQAGKLKTLMFKSFLSKHQLELIWWFDQMDYNLLFESWT